MSQPSATSGTSVAPLHERRVMEFPYKHSTGETIGRFLAGLKEQKKIWGQRVAGQGVVVPPLGYSEVDGSDGGEWVAVKDTGIVTAVGRRPPARSKRLHPSSTPFAFVLVKLDGADTALAHIVTERPRPAQGRRARRGGVGAGRRADGHDPRHRLLPSRRLRGHHERATEGTGQVHRLQGLPAVPTTSPATTRRATCTR